MAEICISFAAKIAEYLVEPTLRQLRYMCCFNNIVEDLRQENRQLTVAQEQLEIKVKRARGNAEDIRKDVETWLEDTKIFIEEAKSLQIEAEENKNCLNGWCPNLCCRYWFGRKAAKKKLAIKNHQEEISKFTQVGDPANLLNPGFISFTGFFSSKATESATHQIMEALKDENVNMIGLQGMGGSGKTTLVKDLGGTAHELKLFDAVVIAVVSQTPNVKNIQGQIADPLRIELKGESNSGRASLLRMRLKSEKKILIILDDVWAPLDLTEIGIPFGNDHKGCKILLTTRRQHVCTTMECQETIKLDLLSEDEAWALFKKNTGLDNDDSTLTNVAMEVTRECKGLPLAIVTVGRALREKAHDEYTEALDNLKNARFVNIEDDEKKVYACLKLSYDYLKNKETQSCFLLCSLFPEDYEIDIEDLARIGWGKGLFPEAKTIEDARRKMRVRMKELQNSGLLIDADEDQFVKIHDMVRDVALYIAKEGESAFMVRTGARLKTWPDDRSLERYTAISLMDNDIEELPNGLVCPNLNTLLLEGDGVSMTISDAFFEEMKALKVLSICKGILEPQSLQFLTNLQTLRLDFCKFNDISSLGKLKKLGILRLYGSTIVELPNEIGELNDLKLLDLNGCVKLKKIPPLVISKLSKLEELYIEFYIDQWWSMSVNLACDWLWELNSLSHLAVLSLEFDAKYLPMDFAFPKLARYKINVLNSFMGYPNSRTLGMKDIDATSLNAFKELFPTVEYLDLESAVGFQNIIPNMNQGGLKNLISLRLKSCREMECLIDSTQQQVPTTAFSNVAEGPTQHVSLQSLRYVQVSKCEKLMCLFSSSLARSLVQLQKLKIESCEGLEQIIIIEKEDGEILSEAHLQPFCFPKLTTLKIKNCVKLEYTFPISIARDLQLLEKFIISDAPQLKQVFGHGREDDGNDIVLPQLRELELRKLSSLTSFYEGNYHWKWPSLQKLTVVKCPKLSTSFITDVKTNLLALQKLRIGNRILLAKAISLLQRQSLQKLEDLAIENCEGVQEIFHGISTDRDDEFSVTNLKGLYLEDVPELKVIWKGPTQISSFQNLISLHLKSCCEMECLIDSTQQQVPTTAFSNVGEGNHVMPLSNLRSLDLDDLPELKCLWTGPTQHVSLQSLRYVQVSKCEKLTCLFSSSLARSLVQLQRLKIESCEGLEQIIIIEKEDGEILSEAHLQPFCFPKLTTLEIRDCAKLEYTFPISVTRDLQLLDELIIVDAPQLKQVFGHGRKEDGNDIVLPQLRELELRELSSLTSFYEGNYHWKWPSLQKLTVEKCPKLSTSFITDVETNLLALQKQLRVLRIGNRILLAKANILLQRQSLQKLEELAIVNCEGAQEIFHGISTDRVDEFSVSNLKKLYLQDVPELRVIWKGPTQISSFQNLTRIEIYNCKKLEHIFSPSVARNLQRLEYLSIWMCEELERIIDEDEEDQIISLKPHLQQQPIRFPNLKTIEVHDCNKLKSLFPITIARGLPQLEYLTIARASELEEVFRHENEEDLRDENKILLQQLYWLGLVELPRLISFCPGGYHFIFPSLNELTVRKCPNITTSFTMDSDRSVHAKVKAKAKAETPQLVKEEMAEGSSTAQATVPTVPSDSDSDSDSASDSDNFIHWNRRGGKPLPPYMEESSGNL